MTVLAHSSPRAADASESAELHSPIAGVRLWLASLDGAAQHDAAAWLAATEQARAARFVFARDATRYRAAHVLLRRLLWAHCELPAGEEFVLGEQDKPHPRAGRGWGFNLSHSEGHALIGIGAEDGVGVDIEVLRDVSDIWPLAEQNFSANEYEELRRAPKEQLSRAFLSGWTRKEACLKAVGCGLSIAPSGFEVGLAPAPKVLTLQTDSGAVDVLVHSVQAGENALAAVARTLCTPPDQEPS